jgi:hypothetical protein
MYIVRGRPSMRHIEITVVKSTKDDGRRLRRVIEILAEGMFSSLEEGDYLKDDDKKEKEVEGK